ncbi:MAG: hypothetical protein HY514_04960 [Candidatus Aenigmarchaeota archaeon]|nr:hypothetical protein [Candidatus Aenigmarchaeota archaeon]
MYEYPLFEGRPLVPTKDCQREMDEIMLNLWQVKDVLEQGYDCSRSRRAQSTVERCLYRKGKEIRVVAALVEWREGSFWRIIHVGKTGGH